MTKLKEASVQHFLALDEETRDEDNSYLDGFIAGALWLLEQANKVAFESMKETTLLKNPDMRAMELVRRLEELCQSQEGK